MQWESNYWGVLRWNALVKLMPAAPKYQVHRLDPQIFKAFSNMKLGRDFCLPDENNGHLEKHDKENTE